MAPPRCAWVSFVLACLLTLPLAGQDYAGGHGKLADRAISKLEELATWTERRGLAAERMRVAELILLVDGDHGASRKHLGYERNGDDWRRVRRPKVPLDADTKKLPEFFALRLDIVNRYRTDVLKLLARNRKLPATDRYRELQRLLRLDAGADHLVTRVPVVKVKGKRLLPETAIANGRRPVLYELARVGVLVATDAHGAEPDPDEKGTGLAWHGVKTAQMRVLSTGSVEEAVEAAKATESAGALFRAAFGSRMKHRAGLCAYLVSTPAEKTRFAANHPKVSSALRTQLVPNAGGWIDAYRVIHFGARRSDRVDSAVRQVLSLYAGDAWKLSPAQGWAYEGVGLWLTHAVVGSRRTWFTRPLTGVPSAESKARRRLWKPKANWWKEAKRVINADSRLSLGSLMRRNSNDLIADEVVYSHALSGYLIESFPLRAGQVLKATGAGKTPTEVVQQHLGWSVSTLEERLHRFINERPRR